MAIVFGSDTGIRQDAADTFWDGIKQQFNDVKNGLGNMFSLTPTTKPRAPKERVHVDNGFTNVAGTAFVGSSIDNVDDVQERIITSQEPQLTVYIKKRAFRALRNENDLKYFDDGEKLFIRATKLLFEKKCQQLGAYEALTKAKRLLDEEVDMDVSRINAIVDMITSTANNLEDSLTKTLDAHNSTFPTDNLDTWNFQSQSIIKSIETIKQTKDEIISVADGFREIGERAESLRHETLTTWVVDERQPDVFMVGRGSGVIELTLVSELNTSLNLDGSVGSIDFTMQDPYNLTKITNDDIEGALGAAKAELNDPENQALGPQAYYEEAIRKEEQLRILRKDRISRMLGIANSGNSILSGSDATEIIFEVQPSSASQNRVTATVGPIPESFNKSNYAIVLMQLPLEQQLTSEEQDLVVSIFDLLEQYVAELQRINNNYILDNQNPDVEHARRNLRVHYLGKAIIQPMDSVNVYIRGNTIQQDDLVGPFNTLLNESGFIRSFEEDQKVSDTMLEEEMKIFGIDNLGIPVDLYRSIRTGSLMRNAGMHVFGGIITAVSESYSAGEGKYTTRVSGTSNMQWLEQSRVNVAPSLDQTQGLLEDPLTAFDISINPGTGLVVEAKSFPPFNKATRLRMDMGVVIHNDGMNTGEQVDTSNLVHDYFDNGDGTSFQQYKHAPGMAYKWKQGVMAATRNVNLKTALDGSEDQSERLRREMGMTVIQNPFAGQDAADIVSSLVTGFPHNYESFYQSATSVGTFANSSSTNSPDSFFHSFFDIQRSQNRAFGNFQPFKVIKVDPKVMHERLAKQSSLKVISKRINQLRDELARLNDKKNSLTLSPLFKSATDEVEIKTIKSVSGSLDKLITAVTSQIDEASKQFKADASAAEITGMRLYGSDIAFTPYGTTAESESESMKETYARLRLKQTIMQFRPQYDCKFNLDNNLFIIGDEYDKDLDIQAFVVNMSQNISLFNSEFKTPKDMCSQVAKTIDFEFFCDTQGHIQFRPPRYNKVPLSLLLKMMLLDNRQGKRIYPPFLKGFMHTRKDNIDNELKIIDFNISIESILLNKKMTPEEINGIVKSGAKEVETKFRGDLAALTTQKSTDLAKALLETREKLRAIIGGPAVNKNSSGDKEAAAKEILELNDPSVPNMNVKRQIHIDKLAQLISRRQRLLVMQTNITKQAKNFDDVSGNISQKMKPDDLNQIADLIEDDANDFLGPNSSKRFIIYDHQLISSTFTESSDNVVCRVDVSGEQDLIGEGPGNIGNIPILWAGATDFDLWRQYGYKSDGGVSRPFLKDAETQCAPYALMLLSRNRKNAVQGTVTVTGNEYYQLGDVVYINSRDTLFYVTAISHSFSYDGGNFTTSLTLQYGHTLGDYIPSPLDVIGKGMIKSQKAINQGVTSRKTSGKLLGRHVATIIFPSEKVSRKDMLSGIFGRFNLNELKNTLAIASNHVTALKSSDYPKLEIHGFAFDEHTKRLSKERIYAVINWLKSPTGLYVADDDRFVTLSNDYVEKSIKSPQISTMTDPIMLLEDLNKNGNYLRVPKEEVFSAMPGTDPSKLSDMVEVVIVFGDTDALTKNQG